MFDDVKGYSMSLMHMKPQWVKCTNVWLNLIAPCLKLSGIDNLAKEEECTRIGQPCTIHPGLAPSPAPGAKVPRASACSAKDNVHRRFQHEFQEKLGLR